MPGETQTTHILHKANYANLEEEHEACTLSLCAWGAGFSCPEASSGFGQGLTSQQSLQPKIRNSLLVTMATIQFFLPWEEWLES